MTPASVRGAMISSLILLEILAISLMKSPWPWAIVGHESLMLRILGWFLVAQFFFGILTLVVLHSLATKKCVIGNHDLVRFIPVFGEPVICKGCKSYMHKLCLKGAGKCPICGTTPDGGKTRETSEIPFDFTDDG